MAETSFQALGTFFFFIFCSPSTLLLSEVEGGHGALLLWKKTRKLSTLGLNNYMEAVSLPVVPSQFSWALVLLSCNKITYNG